MGTNPVSGGVAMPSVAASSSPSSPSRHIITPPTRNSTPTAIWSGVCGSLRSSDPSVTASTTWMLNAAAAPDHTARGRL